MTRTTASRIQGAATGGVLVGSALVWSNNDTVAGIAMLGTVICFWVGLAAWAYKPRAGDGSWGKDWK